MKKAFLCGLIVFGYLIGYAQSKNIVGAWLWRDSTTSFSLFIKEDGTIAKHIGPIKETILVKNLKHGTYKFKDQQKVSIIWNDKSSDIYKVGVINNYTLQIQIITPGSNALKTYTFQKVVDEEVIEG